MLCSQTAGTVSPSVCITVISLSSTVPCRVNPPLLTSTHPFLHFFFPPFLPSLSLLLFTPPSWAPYMADTQIPMWSSWSKWCVDRLGGALDGKSLYLHEKHVDGRTHIDCDARTHSASNTRLNTCTCRSLHCWSVNCFSALVYKMTKWKPWRQVFWRCFIHYSTEKNCLYPDTVFSFSSKFLHCTLQRSSKSQSAWSALM